MFQYDLAIIGGGPAGVAAATMAMSARIKFVLIAPDIGGKINYGFSLQDLPETGSIWGVDSTHEMVARIKAYPERYISQKVTAIVREDEPQDSGTEGIEGTNRIEKSVFRITMEGAQGVERTIRSRAIIVATGANPRRLHIEGEEEFWGRGVSYSTVSHAGLMQGRDVAVIGLGIRAVTAALWLATIANHVYLLPKTALPDDDGRVAQLRDHPKVSIMDGWAPQRFIGDEYLRQISLTRDRTFCTLDVDTAFIEMGLLPEKGFLRGLIDFDPETGQIPINQVCETAVPGLYAAGDVTNTFAEQIPVAIGEGIKATLSAWGYLATR